MIAIESAIVQIPAYWGHYESPIGLVEIGATSTAIISLHFVEQSPHTPNPSTIINAAIRQTSEYFDGVRREFDLRIALSGTTFQVAVWRHLLTVSFGHTSTYQGVARAIGRPRAVRAVGGANGRNPISLIVPCHRIIGSDGKLTGYGGGLWRKRWLLEHESAVVASSPESTY